MKERWVLKKTVKRFLWATLVFLIVLILTKNNQSLKNKINEFVYEKNLPMTVLRKKYDSFFSWKNKEVIPVSKEIILKKGEEQTDSGVKLMVEKHQTIPNLESGMVILVEQEKVIIEQIDGVTATYSNINCQNLKIYDYLEKGEIIGEASKEEVFISFTKEGVYYDYKNYL